MVFARSGLRLEDESPAERSTAKARTLVIRRPAASVTMTAFFSGAASRRRQGMRTRTASAAASTRTTARWLPSPAASQASPAPLWHTGRSGPRGQAEEDHQQPQS